MRNYSCQSKAKLDLPYIQHRKSGHFPVIDLKGRTYQQERGFKILVEKDDV